MKKEKLINSNNSISPHKTFHNYPYLTRKKLRKFESQNNSNKNKINSTDIKTLNQTSYYYKDPNFFNESNLKYQLHVLKTINKEKMNLNKDFIEEGLPSIYHQFTTTTSYINRYNNEINDYYNRVFKMKPLFRKIKPIVDNKLNMKYAENEEQYKKIVEKEKKILLSQGKKPKNKKLSEYITLKVDDIKTRIRFMKGIVDFSFPGFVLTKIKAIDKKLKLEKDYKTKLKNYHSPVENRNQNIINRRNERKDYLFECINIQPNTNNNDSK